MPLGNWFKSPPFRLESNINAVVSNIETASAWYREKLGLKVRPRTDLDVGDWDDVEDTVVCKFLDNEEEPGIYLMKLAQNKDDGERLSGSDFLYCQSLQEAEDLLTSRGVSVGAVQEDGDGSRYFLIQDLDGNKLQILEG